MKSTVSITKSSWFHLSSKLANAIWKQMLKSTVHEFALAVLDILSWKKFMDFAWLLDAIEAIDRSGLDEEFMLNVFKNINTKWSLFAQNEFFAKLWKLSGQWFFRSKFKELVIKKYVEQLLKDWSDVISCAETIRIFWWKKFIVNIVWYSLLIDESTNKVEHISLSEFSSIKQISDDVLIKISKPVYSHNRFDLKFGYMSLKDWEFRWGLFDDVVVKTIKDKVYLYSYSPVHKCSYMDAISWEVLMEWDVLWDVVELANWKCVLKNGNFLCDFHTGEKLFTEYMYPQYDNENNIGFFSNIVWLEDGSYYLFWVKKSTNVINLQWYIDLNSWEFFGGEDIYVWTWENSLVWREDFIYETFDWEKCYKANWMKTNNYLLVDMKTSKIIYSSKYPIEIVFEKGMRMLKTRKRQLWKASKVVEISFDEVMRKFYPKNKK